MTAYPGSIDMARVYCIQEGDKLICTQESEYVYPARPPPPPVPPPAVLERRLLQQEHAPDMIAWVPLATELAAATLVAILAAVGGVRVRRIAYDETCPSAAAAAATRRSNG